MSLVDLVKWRALTSTYPIRFIEIELDGSSAKHRGSFGVQLKVDVSSSTMYLKSHARLTSRILAEVI